MGSSCSRERTRSVRRGADGGEWHVVGEEYYSTNDYSYRSSWNDQVTLTKRPYTIADLLNIFSAAGLWVETAAEPRLPPEAARRYPHKQAWMNTYLGILIFKLRPLTAAGQATR